MLSTSCSNKISSSWRILLLTPSVMWCPGPLPPYLPDRDLLWVTSTMARPKPRILDGFWSMESLCPNHDIVVRRGENKTCLHLFLCFSTIGVIVANIIKSLPNVKHCRTEAPWGDIASWLSSRVVQTKGLVFVDLCLEASFCQPGKNKIASTRGAHSYSSHRL